MAKRQKRKKRHLQLIATTALVTSTIVPYTVNAEDIIKDTSEEIDQSSGGNILPDNHIDVITNNTTTSGISEEQNTEAIREVYGIDNVIQTFNITVNFEKKIDCFEHNATLAITADGKKYVQLKVSSTWRNLISSLTSENTDIVLSSKSVMDSAGNKFINLEMNSIEDFVASVPMCGQGIISFPNITDEFDMKNVAGSDNRNVQLTSEPEEQAVELTSEQADSNASIKVSHSFTAEEVQAGQFGSVPGSFIENYLAPYFTDATVVTIDGKKYIELTLVGKAYGVVRFEGAELVSSVGEKMDQMRVFRIPAAKTSTHEIDAGTYGVYDLTFTFDVTDEQIADVSVTEPEPEPEKPVVDPTPEPADSNASIKVSHSFTAEEVQAGQFGSVPGSFIENYLSPYFSDATVVTIDGKKYIELTLVGKAYGVVRFEGAELVSSVGEKMDQMRVFRIPAAKTSTHEIDAGTYGVYDLTFTFDVTDEQIADVSVTEPEPEKPVVDPTPELPVEKPTDPVQDEKVAIKDIGVIPIEKEVPISFNIKLPNNEVQTAVQTILSGAKAKQVKVGDTSKLLVTIPVVKQGNIHKIEMYQGEKIVGVWQDKEKIIAALKFVANDNNQLEVELDSIENINFKVYTSATDVTPYEASVESVTVPKSVFEETKQPEIEKPTTPPTGGTGNGEVTPKPTPSKPTENIVALEVIKSVTHSFTSKEVAVGKYGSVGGDFISNYLAPYFSNAQLVTVNGMKYIQMTLTGKAYGISSFSGGEFVSSTGSGMDQVRVVRVPATKTGTYRVNAGDYGIYDLTFTFGLTDADLVSNVVKPSETKPAETKPEVVTVQSTGDAEIKLAVTEENKELTKYINKFDASFKVGKYNVKISLANTTGMKQFIVKQDGKEIAHWKNPNTTAYIASLFGAKISASSNELSFEVASLEGITLEAITSTGSLTAAVQATSKVVTEKPKPVNGEISYTMQADPADSMSGFITNYLAPYFTKVKAVEVNGQQHIEMTLVGKAYGFASIKYEDATGKLRDVEVVSSTGEKMNQVRVIRLPLIKDKDGITKVRVDSGDLGYGAYTLHFKYNVEETNIKPNETITNPFKDIAKSSYSGDILALYKAGITTGTSDTTFSPTKNMTRAQFAVMIARALNLTTTKEVQFKDVKGKWYAAEVQALAEVGIITGVNTTTFNPNKSITRQQAAAMIYRMLEFKGYKATATTKSLNYKDAGKIADYAKLPLAELQATKIMTGYNGYINGAQNLTRGQMAKILKGSLELIGYEL